MVAGQAGHGLRSFESLAWACLQMPFTTDALARKVRAVLDQP